MRRSLALLTMTLLSLSGCAASKTTHSTTAPSSHGAQTSAAPPGGYSKNDGDEDFDDTGHYDGSPANDDRELLASYGPRASPAVAHAVASLVKRYYAASTAGNGTATCSLLTASLAAGLSGPSQTGRNGSHTCAAAMSQLLAQQHERLLSESVATMSIRAVHVKGNLGLAVIASKTAPESEIVLEREGQAWKIDALFAGYMP